MTVWKKLDNWQYEYFPDTEPASTFTGAEAFVELWHAKKNGRRFPSRDDFDWYELEPWWGRLGISRYFHDPFDWEYILFGTDMTETFQFDGTGKKGTEVVDDVFDGGDDLAFYEFVVENGYIARSSGNIHWQDRTHVDVMFVFLPLSDSDDTVTHCIELLV